MSAFRLNALLFLHFVQLKDPEWAPDFGPARFVPSWGATVTGARKFLIAYNVNLLSTKQQAHRIALNIREAGRGPNEVRQRELYCSIIVNQCFNNNVVDSCLKKSYTD